MRPRDRAALILVAIALGWACLAVGGAPRWAAVTGALLAVATAVPYVTSRRAATKISPMLWPLVVMVGLTALQLVPLPIALAEQVVPAKVALIRANAHAWGEGAPGWVLASHDPPATLVELAKLVGYLALAWTCTRLAAERACRPWLVTIAAGVATTAALITLGHHVLGLDLLYGIYRPSARLPVLGPLIGVNHLASLLTLAVPLAIALAVRGRGAERIGWIASALVLGGTGILTGSRGGLLGLAAALVVVATVLVVQRRAGSDSSRRVPMSLSLPAVALIGATIVLTAVLTGGTLSRELAGTRLDELEEPEGKYQVWVRAAHLSVDNHWLGVGKGGFEPAFTPHAATVAISYSHVENGYLQAIVDWGVPGAAALFLSLLVAARAAARRWRQGSLEAGALAAVAALAVHDLADFSIELPAVAMTIIVAAAILLPARLGAAQREDRDRPPSRGVPRAVVRLRAGAIAAGVILVALAASPLGRAAPADARRVLDAAPAERLAVARAAFARHPADHVLAARAAEALLARRDGRAVKVIARALAMRSEHPGLHRLAGRILAATDRADQAAAEFAAASRLARDVRPVVADVLAVFREPARIAEALAAEPGQAAQIALVLRQRNRPDAALAYAVRTAYLNPKDARAQAVLADCALIAGDHATAAAAAAIAWSRAPTARNATLVGEAMLGTGEAARAIPILTGALGRTTRESAFERVRLYGALADLHLAAGDAAGAKPVLERAGEIAGTDPGLRVLVHMRLARVEDALGNTNQAAWERREAARLSAEQQAKQSP